MECARQRARASNDFATADTIRDDLARLGIVLEDGREGTAGFGDRVEGLHATTAALAAGRLTRLIAESGRANREPVAGLVAQAHRTGVTVDLIDDVRPGGDRGTSRSGRGGSAHPYRSLDDLVALGSPVALLVLDHIEDPHNLGAAASFGAGSGDRRAGDSAAAGGATGPAAMKAAAGALSGSPWPRSPR